MATTTHIQFDVILVSQRRDGHVSEQRPERPPTAQFLAALKVKRNLSIGLACGTLLAVFLFVTRVFLVPTTRAPTEYYLALAFVVAVTVGGMVAVILTIYSAVSLSRELADDDREAN